MSLRWIAAVVASLSAYLIGLERVVAEDLNQLFGPSWTCNDITPAAPGDPLTLEYNACIKCNFSQQDFFRDPPGSNPAGHCIPKPSVATPPPQAGNQPSGAEPSAPYKPGAVRWQGFAWETRKDANGGISVALGYSGSGGVDSQKAAEDVALVMCRNVGGNNCGSSGLQNSFSLRKCEYALACGYRVTNGPIAGAEIGYEPDQLAATCKTKAIKDCQTQGGVNCDSGQLTVSRIIGGCLQVDTQADGVFLSEPKAGQ